MQAVGFRIWLHRVRLRIGLHRREIVRRAMVILFVMGFAFTGLASYFIVDFVTAPVYSFKTGYRGFGIAQNDSVIPLQMTVDVTINPPELWFDYYFAYRANGTYIVAFAFPFKIVEQYGASENMSTILTSQGSAVWLQYRDNNVSSFGAHEIWGYFAIENTFQEGTRGSYTIILPFGIGISSELVQDMYQTLKMPVQSGNVNITLEVTLPGSFRPTTIFPPNSKGPEPIEAPFNKTFESMTWDAGTLQSSVTIEAVDTNEKSFYDYIPFTSGIFLGIGVQLMFTIGYDWIRKWAQSPKEED